MSPLTSQPARQPTELVAPPNERPPKAKRDLQNQWPAMPQPEALASGASMMMNSLIRTVNPGDRVNIPCSLANMGGSIQFAKDDQPIILDSGCAHCQLDISNDGQASLTINRVSSKDQGHWQCWRLDANGKVKQKIPIIQLVITNSPELPILIVNDKELLLGGNNLDATITIKENELVSFKCLIKGASSPVDYVHWMLDSSQNVTHQSQLMMEFSPQEQNYLTQSVLKLNATKSMNLKSISCLSNHHQWLTPMTVTAFLNVLYEPSFTISREPGFGIPVSEGMTVILRCEIDSNPSSSPIWIKDADNKTANAANQAIGQGQSVTGKEAIGEPIVLETQEDGSVMFQPAQRTDSGWYRCKTENKYGNFSSFGYYLNVRPNPQNSQATSQTANNNNQLQQQQQQQQPSLSSTSQPVQGPQQALARFSNANTNNNQGQQPAPLQHPSLARNSVEAPATAGQYPARVMAPNQPAALGRTGQMSPSLAMMNNMMNNDQPMASNPPMPFNAFQAAPTLPNMAGAGSGSDRCKGGGARLADGFPEIDHPVTTVNAVLGRQLILHLRFCCNPGPARVFWIHRHLAMIPGRMFGPYITRDIYTTYNSFYCYESTFEIESVKPEDIGTVYVFVSNEKGHAGAQIHIQLSTANNNKQNNNINDSNQHALGTRFPFTSSSSATISGGQSYQLMASLLTIASSLLLIYLMRPTTATRTLDSCNLRAARGFYVDAR